MGKAKQLLHQKYVYSDGAIREMTLWELPIKSKDRPHGLKYSLYYGSADGVCIVRYDNEIGKGDHKHMREIEEPYSFINVETLIADFNTDIATARGGGL
jgi:hypothetical protein